MKLFGVFLILGVLAACSTNQKIASSVQKKMRVPAAEETFDVSTVAEIMVVNAPGTHTAYAYTSDKNSDSNVWGPIHSATSLEDAKNICAHVTDLNLQWSLPTSEQFLKAFNSSNPEETANEMYPRVFADVEKSDTTYWATKNCYYVHTGQFAANCGSTPHKFRCFGHKKN
ncbi:MAG: hypothetical protein ACXVAX_01110 [Pseudobdellovibrio sp.]